MQFKPVSIPNATNQCSVGISGSCALFLALGVSVLVGAVITAKARAWVDASNPWFDLLAVFAIENHAAIIRPGAHRGSFQS